MTQVRIVLVDDSGIFLDSAAEFLAHDPRVRVVGRALNGLDAARAIKVLPSPPLVVIVTLHDERGYRLDAHAAGFICKADFAPEVTAVIDSLFSHDPSRDPRSGSRGRSPAPTAASPALLEPSG